jgi:hypothetical protein
MRAAVIWVDSAAGRRGLACWNPVGAPACQLAIVGDNSRADCVDWVKRGQFDALLVMAESKFAARAALLANVVSTSSPRLLVAHQGVAATGFGTLAVAHAELSRGLDPATLLRRIDDTVSRVIDGVWLPSVARLRAPSPGLRHRLASKRRRGEGFVVRHGTQPTVQSGAIQGVVPNRSAVAVFGSEDGVHTPALVQSFPDAQSGFAPALVDIKARYGVDGIEFAYIDHLSKAEPGSASCQICGLPVYGAACVFCHVKTKEARLSV